MGALPRDRNITRRRNITLGAHTSPICSSRWQYHQGLETSNRYGRKHYSGTEILPRGGNITRAETYHSLDKRERHHRGKKTNLRLGNIIWDCNKHCVIFGERNITKEAKSNCRNSLHNRKQNMMNSGKETLTRRKQQRIKSFSG